MDYLLKPAEPERLARALDRFRTRSAPAAQRRPAPSQLLIPDRGRTHRSAAVALAHVQQVVTRDSGDATVLLGGGQQAPCSRQFRGALMERLSSLPR